MTMKSRKKASTGFQTPMATPSVVPATTTMAKPTARRLRLIEKRSTTLPSSAKSTIRSTTAAGVGRRRVSSRAPKNCHAARRRSGARKRAPRGLRTNCQTRCPKGGDDGRDSGRAGQR